MFSKNVSLDARTDKSSAFYPNLIRIITDKYGHVDLNDERNNVHTA